MYDRVFAKVIIVFNGILHEFITLAAYLNFLDEIMDKHTESSSFCIRLS